jgi:hypothetical protein
MKRYWGVKTIQRCTTRQDYNEDAVTEEEDPQVDLELAEYETIDE